MTHGRHALMRAQHAADAWHASRLASALAAGPVRLAVHTACSPLQSASLLASAVRSRVVRGREHIGAQAVMRRVLDVAAPRMWAHETPCAHRVRAVAETRALLGMRAAVGDRLAVLAAGIGANHAPCTRDTERLRMAEDVLAHMERGVVAGSLHPEAREHVAAGSVRLALGGEARTASARACVRGVLVCLRGPKRGTRAAKWLRSAGRVSVNSVGHVVAEEAKVAVPSKLGVYGLTVRLVWTLASRLVSPYTPMVLADRDLSLL